MPTLNKTKKETRVILKWGGISLLTIFLFLALIRFATFIKESLAPPPPPEAFFGKLPTVPFPNQIQENTTYSLDTLTGFLPNFSDRAKVYKITANPPTLLGFDKAQEKAAQIGFTSRGVQIAEDVYQWLDQGSSLPRRITINIFSLDFTLSSPYLVTPSLQTFNDLNEQNRAIEKAQSFLLSLSLLPTDLDEKKTKATLYSIEKSTLSPTSKISNAKIVRVNFFQKDLNNLPIYYEKGATSAIDLLIGKENNELKVIDARYFHKNISENSSTYTIKSASEAFSELKQQKAYVASKPQDTVEITIKKVLLGYYIGEDSQDFLMPIIIFEGDNDFVAYVSAVRDEWISN